MKKNNKLFNISFYLVLPVVLVFGILPRPYAQNVQSENPSKIVESSKEIELPTARITDKKGVLLVSSGIPFAPGELFFQKDIAFFDKNGNEIPIATKILARWPQDNSIRSILVQFKQTINYNYQTVIMKWGAGRKTQNQELVEVTWDMPEAIVLLPPIWLCKSKVAGEQIPVEYDRLTGAPKSPYDKNIYKVFMKIKGKQLSDDTRKDKYYDAAYVMYQLFTRTGDVEFFKFARKVAVQYRDKEIIHEGPERGRNRKYRQSRYIYVQGLAADYLLTGDEKSLLVAGYMAEYLKNHFFPENAFFPKYGRKFWTEREQAFPFLGISSYYELTGNQEYLNVATKFMANLLRTQNQWPERGGFIHNVYKHDVAEGCGKNEYGGSPFMTGLLLEAIIDYHRITNSAMAEASIFKALDWLIKEGLAPDGSSFLYLTKCSSRMNEGHPDHNLFIVHAFGYGYKLSNYTRRDYFEVGQRIFKRGVKDGWLGDQKHFYKNYRSSGHFLAYIQE